MTRRSLRGGDGARRTRHLRVASEARIAAVRLGPRVAKGSGMKHSHKHPVKAAAVLATLGLAVASAGPAAAEQSQLSTSIKTFDVKVELSSKADEKPAEGDSGTSAASLFRAVPETVTISAGSGVKLSRSARARGSDRLSFSTGGKSTCVTVYASQRDAGVVPLQYSFVKKGDKDPCTGQAVTKPIADFTTPSPEPLAWVHTYWKLKCSNGKCHWIKVKCHHAEGID